MITLALWPTVTVHQNGIIAYALASELQCDGWCCENLSLRSFYLCAKCNSLFANYTGLQGMGEAANISPRVPSTCAQNAMLSLIIIYIIPSRQIDVAIDNPSFVLSVSCLITSSYLWNDMRAADNSSHAENFQSNGCRCCFHLYKFRDRIQVTRVFRYCSERQAYPVLNESSILV